MVAQYSYQEDPPEQNLNPNLPDLDDAEEEEDTLSLCDLSIYSDAANSEDYSTEDQSSSSSDQDFFEFFGDQWTPKSYPLDNIIFCGKVIPYKLPVSDFTQKLEINKHQNQIWNFKSEGTKGGLGEKNEVLDGRASILTAPAKSKWYLFMFGLGRFSTEVDIRGMRKRQNRRSAKSFGGSKCGEKTGRNKWKGMWGLIGVLGCGGSHHATIVNKCIHRCIE